jgi:hypothetical protein
MSPRHARGGLVLIFATSLLIASCGSGAEEQASFGSSKIQGVPTNVSGSGTTSGIGAGSVLSPAGSAPGAGTPTPTVTPTVTPAPSK